MQSLPEDYALVNIPEFQESDVPDTLHHIGLERSHKGCVDYPQGQDWLYMHCHFSHPVNRLLLKELSVPHKSLQMNQVLLVVA
jgi:hypothetical protein